jgi:hypothetical protein
MSDQLFWIFMGMFLTLLIMIVEVKRHADEINRKINNPPASKTFPIVSTDKEIK